MKISILLPFKENYSKNEAGAVSIFVNDITNSSVFKKNIKIFGSTNSRNYLSKNYINIHKNNIFFQSSNKNYVKNFLLNKEFTGTDILEVHNRPNYIKLIKEKYNNQIFFYFHNDPLKMDGSKTLAERKFLQSNVDRIFFNSKWSRNQFYNDFDNNDINKNKSIICFQSTNKTKINFSKKENIISFIGKLNTAKGYDIFGKAILKILDKYKTWKAVVIGDEPREKLSFSHKNLKIFGFRSNKFILNLLKKVSISLVPSRWEEPFGRASLEAASRGSCVIISNRGGLTETSKSAIILKKINEKEIYKEISYLIENNSKLLSIQKSNYKNFYLTHKFVSQILDKERKKFIFSKFNIHSSNVQKILHVTNFNHRFDGRLQYNTGRRINNGFIRLGHNVLTISDRDIINQNKNFADLSGQNILQKKIINAYQNFKPTLLVLGHADAVNEETLNFFKKKGVKISQWFLDPVTKNGPDYLNNKKRLLKNHNLIDNTFLTTDPRSLDFKLNNSFYMPNPCDQSFEVLKNYNYNCPNDIFFAMSHGVHRGKLKKNKKDNREVFLNELMALNPDIIFDVYGMNKMEPIWANEFIDKISLSNMGLNLSRGKPTKYYSSDRIAQLIGNGLLTFIDEKTSYNDFFSNKEVVFYKDLDDLSYKINKFKRDDYKRRQIARNGRNKYFKYFNSSIIAQYILDKTFNTKNKKYFWEKKIK